MIEPEITTSVDLCTANGRLHPTARGWSRAPMLRANLRGARGRKKRWDYWCVITDEVVMSMVYADVDYAGLASVWVMEHATGAQSEAGMIAPFARGFSLPDDVCTGTVALQHRALTLRIEESPECTHLVASAPTRGGKPAIEFDVRVAKPIGHESLNVIIPWSDRRFQFTSKQNSRPATGQVTMGDHTFIVDAAHDAWGVQDLGRGVWPYSIRWNWASGSGRAVDGRVIGLQFGAKWTEGTGATENALCIDGRLTKISEELEFSYDWNAPMRPWRIRSRESDAVDLTLTPTFDRHDLTDLKLLRMEVHQEFGFWSGRVVGEDGVPVHLDGVRGFAEEARNRW